LPQEFDVLFPNDDVPFNLELTTLNHVTILSIAFAASGTKGAAFLTTFPLYNPDLIFLNIPQAI
jgi:hypothetical protein